MQSIAREFHMGSLLKFAFPTMIMMVFMSLYTIVDGIFVSRVLGSNALSALNIVWPFLNLVLALGIMLATGGSAIVAKEMGQGEEKKAQQDFTALALVGAGLALVLLAAGAAFLEPLCRLLGATPVLMADSKTYLLVLLAFAPVTVLQLYFQTFFVTAGKPGLGLILTALGGVTNMVLDYVLMVPVPLGIAGAAIATGMGQAVVALVGLVFFFTNRKGLRFVIPRWKLSVFGQACYNGASEMVSNLSTAVITYLFNWRMLQLLGEDGVAAITIVLYGQFLFTSLYFGFTMGVAPVFSYNYGSGNHRQLQRLYKICTRFILASSVGMTLLALFLAPVVVQVFTPKETATYQIAVWGFFLFSFNYIFAGINLFGSGMFTALSNGRISAILSFFRTFVFIALSILLLPQVLGVDGVWLAVPVAELFTAFITFYYFRTQRTVYRYA